MTFHGLATYCIMPCYDDMALFDAIEGVETGELEVKNKLSISGVMIDEAQDFRPSFERVLRLVLDLRVQFSTWLSVMQIRCCTPMTKRIPRT